MKKFYLLFAMLLGFAIPTFAQEEDDPFGFKLKTIQIGAALDSFEPNTWYFVYQGRVSGSNTSEAQVLSTGEVPGDKTTDDGGVLVDAGEGQTVHKYTFRDVLGDGILATERANYMLRFIPVEEPAGDMPAYIIQFGSGRYMKEPNKKSNGGRFYTSDNINDAGAYNVYSIEETSVGHFGLNLDYLGVRLDNNGTGNELAAWGSGRLESSPGNNVWSIHSVEWTDVNEYDMAFTALENAYMSHEAYTVEGYFNTSGRPGTYSADSVAAFLQAMQAASVIQDPTVTPTIEELKAMTQAILDTYQAVLNSQVPMSLTDGYYRLRAGMIYTNNVVVGYDEETQADITQAQQVYKYLYSTIDGDKIVAKWITPDFDDVTANCPALWKITNVDGAFDIVNCATDARFNNVTRSATVEMSVENENLIALDVAGTLEDTTYVNIRVSTQAAKDYFYLHQNSHGNGSGVSGNIVGYCSTFDTTPAASEWIFEAVPEEEALQIIQDYEPVKSHDALVAQYKKLKEEATTAIETAKDVQTINLLSDASQLSSPWTDPNEGSLPNLLDGDVATFWHSSWHDNPPHDVVGSHYFQVEMPDGYYSEGLQITFKFTRRNNANNHVTQWSVRGTNEELVTDLTNPLVDKEQCQEVLSASTPFSAQGETITCDPFDPLGYKYLRFYGDATSSNDVFWHVSDVSLYYLKDNPSSQYSQMGDVAVALESLLADQASIEDADVTIDVYQELKVAYDAFMGSFVDPAELRAVLDSVKTVPEKVVVAKDASKVNPGFWADNTTVEALNKTIADATAYDVAGVYTADQSAAYIETLRKQAKAVDDAAALIQTGKWYRIQFPSKEMFDTYGWATSAGAERTNAGGDITTESLWMKYVTIAEYEDGDSGESHWSSSDEDIYMGHPLYFDDEIDIDEPAMSQFRFVAVGDTTYVLQNRATGMYLKAAGTSGGVTLSAHPSFFNAQPIGYGLNAIAAKNLVGAPQSYLHGQTVGNVLVTWNVNTPGSASALFIEEVEDVAADYEAPSFNMLLKPGSITPLCLPVEISAKDENAALYGLDDVTVKEGAIQVSLVSIKGSVTPGRPFICIYGNTDDYDAEATGDTDDRENVLFAHGTEIVAEPQTSGLLKGTYYGETVGDSVIVVDANAFVVSKKSDTWVGANRAYISCDEKYDVDATVTLFIDGKAEDGIESVLQKVAKKGDLYTIDGRLVSRKANLNSLKNYGKGVYILNGTKVTVR